jgi:adenylate cyclase
LKPQKQLDAAVVQQGKSNEAHQQLAEIYSWFTEGFETKDLQEVEILLDGLVATPLL